MRVLTIWTSSEMEFLRALARELGVLTPPRTKAAAFTAVLDRLVVRPRIIILDEPEKLPPRFLDLARDLTDLSISPIVFVGEVDLISYLQAERRVWSRVFQVVEFEPIGASDIVFYAAEVAGLRLDKGAAELAAKDTGGDFREVRRLATTLVPMAKGKGGQNVDREMVRIALKQLLRGN
jgi:DNA transposition AAA+ family ATPase